MCSEGIVCNYTFIVQQGTTFPGQLVEFCALYAVSFKRILFNMCPIFLLKIEET